MKVTDAEGRTLSGKVGNMIYYTRNGRTYARRARIPGKKRKWEKEGRDPRQEAAARRFGTVTRLYSFFAREVSAEIWRAAARGTGAMPQNLFHRLNCGCFDGEGRLTAPERFRFAEGRLVAPPGMRVERLGGGRFAAAWEETEGTWSTASPADRLRAGVIYDDISPTTWPVAETSGTRGEGRGEFRLDPSHAVAHVYLYFEREDGAAWSPSTYFRLATGDGEEEGRGQGDAPAPGTPPGGE